MAPECGATCNFFPIDDETLRYLRADGAAGPTTSPSSRPTRRSRASSTTRTSSRPTRRSSSSTSPTSSRASPARAGRRTACRWPRRSRVRRGAPPASASSYGNGRTTRQSRTRSRRATRRRTTPRATRRPKREPAAVATAPPLGRPRATVSLDGETFALDARRVVIAAITSCTNTSNPAVMVGAGLLAKRAVERGLTRRPWVKSSLAPGSKVVTEYLERGRADALPRRARLQPRRLRLHDVHRQLRPASRADLRGDRRTATSSSARSSPGNRNFEARIHSEVKANYLASPPLVVAYALAGQDGHRSR